MAMPTTTVQGKVILPSGDPATAGTLTLVLSEPGLVNDGATDHRIGGERQEEIGTDGAVDFALVPNDQITRDGEESPGGTIYRVDVLVTSPYRCRWSESWSVDSSPDPVDIGAITRA